MLLLLSLFDFPIAYTKYHITAIGTLLSRRVDAENAKKEEEEKKKEGNIVFC
jgi:hypothetical protein